MNVSTTSFSPTQMILAWMLTLLLLSWFFIFTTLAIYEYLKRKVDWEDIPAPTSPIPIIGKLSHDEHNTVVETVGSPSPHNLTSTEHPSEQGITRLR